MKLKNKFQAIIFDMDGVIIDTTNFHRHIEQAICRKYKINIPPSEWENFQGLTYEAMYDYIVKKYSRRKLSVTELTNENVKLTLKLAGTKVRAIFGALAFIKKANNYFERIALATSAKKAFQEIIFSKFKLAPVF